MPSRHPPHCIPLRHRPSSCSLTYSRPICCDSASSECFPWLSLEEDSVLATVQSLWLAGRHPFPGSASHSVPLLWVAVLVEDRCPGGSSPEPRTQQDPRSREGAAGSAAGPSINQPGPAQPRPAVGGAAPGAGSRVGRILAGPGPRILRAGEPPPPQPPPGWDSDARRKYHAWPLGLPPDPVAPEAIRTPTALAISGVVRSHLQEATPATCDLFLPESSRPIEAQDGEFNEKKTTCGTVCLKYLLFTYNCCFWLAGLAVMAVGIWTLALKSDYISLLASSTYLATAYILVVAGVVVMVTGVLGCCATFKERRNLLRLYFILLLLIFLLEIIAGILAYVYYQQLNTELKENLKDTMIKRYHQPGQDGVTAAVDKLQQEFHCCGSNNSKDWRDSEWIRSGEADNRVVPDSCCKTVVTGCGRRDHASNIYKVEGGCITKLETFIQEHLRVIGAVGIGIACVQVFGMIFTCCLYRSLKLEHY